jgi:hypothetical protein
VVGAGFIPARAYKQAMYRCFQCGGDHDVPPMMGNDRHETKCDRFAAVIRTIIATLNPFDWSK